MAEIKSLKGKILENVLGKGSYGSVVEVKIDGRSELCAGKIIYDILIENDGDGNVVRKYTEECQMMSSLQHINITQYHGVCLTPKYQLPILVMEKLNTNLHDFLETVPNISLLLKLSILTDISDGLLYLHSHSPQIIHRDLTAKNVLLTGSLVAKISDFGNSRLLNLFPQGQQHLTRNPGTPLYMPPEAASLHYGPSLDIFSFGHLSLFVGIQVFPSELREATTPDASNPGKVIGLSEVERRSKYFEMLGNSVPENFLQLIKDCLQNEPSSRPTAEVVMDRLQLLTSETEQSHSKASLLIEKLSIGKYSGKNVLVAGKSNTGKKSFVSCLFGRGHGAGQNQASEVNVRISSPANRESFVFLNEPTDIILLCFRMDDQLGIEDDHLIAELKKNLGKDFIQKTLILLTMANQVKPVAAQRDADSCQEFLKAARDDFVDMVLDALLRQKIHTPTDRDRRGRFILIGAPDSSCEGRMIPDVKDHFKESWIDWIEPLCQALLDFDIAQ